MTKYVIITGGSRGIGLEFTRQYLKKGYHIVIGSRKPQESTELSKLKENHHDRVTILTLDVGSDDSIGNFASEISSMGITPKILINNAGIASGNEKFRYNFGELRSDDLLRTFHINAISPIMVTQKINPLFASDSISKIINISSDSGSITRKKSKGSYGYSASKSALNMISKISSLELKENNVIVIAMHPGWVRTTMIYTENAPLSVEESVSGMINVIDRLNLEDSGKFYNWKGEEMPW
jgi:NAD(P)-dependent dehydrogenase (short-subunit alcohol dehydrogenase family)